MKSIVWGYKDYPITQDFGVPGVNPSWYQYSATLGFPAGYHVGLDIGVPAGTPIYAAEGGKVKQAGFSEYFRPEPVWIEEDDGDIAIYGHLQKAVVKAGQKVRSGDLLGYSGEQTIPGTYTPDGSGPHLHFELRRPKDGAYIAVDPTEELTGATGKVGGFKIFDPNSPGLPFLYLGILVFASSLAIGLALWASEQ